MTNEELLALDDEALLVLIREDRTIRTNEAQGVLIDRVLQDSIVNALLDEVRSKTRMTEEQVDSFGERFALLHGWKQIVFWQAMCREHTTNIENIKMVHGVMTGPIRKAFNQPTASQPLDSPAGEKG